MILTVLALLFAQATTTLAQDRLALCQGEARRDPATAIATASNWLSEKAGPGQSAPQQCLGLAYSVWLRWPAAEEAFLAAFAAHDPADRPGRARLAAMAGNAAMAESRHAQARAHLELAQAEAAAGADILLRGEIATDRAAALVGLGALAEASQALAEARRDAPQRIECWLLSAVLARRLDDLTAAQTNIETAAALAPADPAVGVEAGLIAALQGRDDAARRSWRSVNELAPNSPEAAIARDYLTQLEQPAP